MLPHDSVTGKSRGWHLLTRRKERLSFLHFPGHISSAVWYELVAQLKEAAGKPEDLLHVLLRLSGDLRFAEVFPQLVPGAENERWHIVQRVRALEVFARLPTGMPEDRKLVVALLHESLKATCDASVSSAAYAGDKPFRAELDATRNVISTSKSFCDNCHCERGANLKA
jgi:hypothetical protein